VRRGATTKPRRRARPRTGDATVTGASGQGRSSAPGPLRVFARLPPGGSVGLAGVSPRVHTPSQAASLVGRHQLPQSSTNSWLHLLNSLTATEGWRRPSFHQERNGGAAAARNMGVAAARGEVVVFIDSDLVVTSPSFLSAHAAALRRAFDADGDQRAFTCVSSLSCGGVGAKPMQ
jgi:glycosyltransferase involved in cell wall biosynthesis